MHRPISTLSTGTARRHCCLDANSLVRSRIVAIYKPHLARIDIFGLQTRPCLLKKLHTISAREVRILDQGDRCICSPSDSSVVRDRPSMSLSQLCGKQQNCSKCAKQISPHHVRGARFPLARSSNPTMSRGQTTVASLNTSAKRPPSSGGTNFPHEMPS